MDIIERTKQISVFSRSAVDDAAEAVNRCAAETVPHREGLPSRAFVALLKLVGLTAYPGWLGHVWSALLYALQTGMTYKLLHQSLKFFNRLRDAGTPFFAALIKSNFVAVPNLLQWAALTACFLWGRRRDGTLLAEVRQTLADIGKLPSVSRRGRKAHHAGEYTWALILLLVVGYTASAGGRAASICRDKPALDCACALGELLCYSFIYLCIQLLVMKFIFVGLMLNSGFWDITKELELITARGCEEAHLRQIGLLQRRLYDIFTRLTINMTTELVFIMCYGILVEIVLTLMVVNLSSLEASWLIRLLLYLLSAVVSLAGPCETCQLLLTRLGHCRDLLLQLEWQRPQLAEPCQLLQRSVSRDLETLGDLGLYSARRSTLLSISSTIVTYIIVMMQFQSSEG